VKKLLAAALILVLVGVGVVLTGAGLGWYSKEGGTAGVETDDNANEMRSGEDTKGSARTLDDQVAGRVESLCRMKQSEMPAALDMWGGQSGLDRRISWMAVSGAATGKQKTSTRVRACRLAQVLAGRRPDGMPSAPPADPKAVDALLACLKSEDPALVGPAVVALGTINLSNAGLDLKARMLPEITRILSSENPALARSAMSAAPMLKEASLAPLLIKVWEKNKDDRLTGRAVRGHLKVLMELQLRKKYAAEEPDLSRNQVLVKARTKLSDELSRLGDDPAGWRTYWEKELAGS
jgi:hypothetical protein